MSCTLTLKNIAIARNENIIAHSIDLNLAHKEKIAIIGHNGSGKTTLLETIVGLNKPKSGEIELFHTAVKTAEDFKAVRRAIGYLLQDADDHFLSPIAEDDIAFTLLAAGVDRESARAKTAAIMRDLGIEKLAQKVVYRLSGGEKKLVALAGILIAEPKLLLLDEPTAGLDYNAQLRLVEILKNLDISMAIVSHDKEFLESVAHRFYALEHGGLKPIGGFDHFITHSHDGLPPHTHPHEH